MMYSTHTSWRILWRRYCRTATPAFRILLSFIRTILSSVALAIILYTITSPFYKQRLVPEARLNSEPYFQTPFRCPRTPPRSVHVPQKHSRFNWRNVPTIFPTKSIVSIRVMESNDLPRIQTDFAALSGRKSTLRRQRQGQVKAVFRKCWQSYKAKAWLSDELGPISGYPKTTFGGWGATLVDNLDTLYIMGLYEEFEEAINAAVGIDFGPADSASKINMFETTIRYLGGFLAAYDLTKCRDQRLLDKAVEVGDLIYKSFDTENRMPITRFDLKRAARGDSQEASDNAILAEFGSSSMELTRLSQLTGDMRYYDAVQRLTNAMDEQQNKTKLPGMWPIGISSAVPDLTRGNSFGFGAMSDSAYEYLPKMYALFAGAEPAGQYHRLSNTFMDVAMDKILFRPMVPDNADILFPGTMNIDKFSDIQTLDHGGQHLACFTGGMFLLSGKLFARSDQVEAGRKLTMGCVWAYKNSLLGIMPESFHMLACESTTNCVWNEEEWRAAAQEGRPQGFTTIDDPRYHLRPEAIESVFYLYRITGDESLQDIAWEMFEAINNHTSTQFANAALDDVTKLEAPKSDSMESFWLAETLKYFYLMFSDPDLISLDEFVFNTEAHPFRRPQK